jgi:group I intron endonuclease
MSGLYLVYAHVRPDTGNIFYVGKGTTRRVRQSANRNLHWHRIVKKCGRFEAIILHDGLDEQTALTVEVDEIKRLRELGFKLANLTDGGDGISGYRHSKEAKEKMSLSQKGRPAPNKGVTPSDEARKRMSQAKLGRKLTPEHCAKLRIKRNKPLSEDTKAKISAALTGKPLSEEHIAKFSKPVICLNTGEIYKSAREACAALNLWPGNISKVCKGKLLQTGGFRFSFYDAKQHEMALTT